MSKPEPIHAICPCVNYSDLLARSIDRWAGSCSSLLVVTDHKDEATVDLATSHGVQVVQTTEFYANNAKFDKAGAMNLGMLSMPQEGWWLFIDADVIPPEDWIERVRAQNPRPGTLHGAIRVEDDGAKIDDGELAGFFMLFHTSDPRAKSRPLLQRFMSAGGYDSAFQARWPRHLKRFLDLHLTHIGERGVHWCGRDNAEGIQELREERRRRGGWRHERIGN